MIELSLHNEDSIIRHHIGPSIERPAHSFVVCEGKSLLGALQKFYPDYWFSELSTLPSGLFDVIITPRDGLVLKKEQQSIRLIEAYEQSFGLKISFDEKTHVATIK